MANIGYCAFPLDCSLTLSQSQHLADGHLGSDAESRGGEVEDDRVQAGVEGTKQQGVVPPRGAGACEKTQHMGEVVGKDTHKEDGQSTQRHPDGLLLLARADPGERVQDPDTAEVAEDANYERNQAEHDEELQTHREEDGQLLFGEVLVADGGVAWGEVRMVLDDEHDAAVGGGEKPDDCAGHHRIERFVKLVVGDGIGHRQVTDHTDSHQQERAGVDSGEEGVGSDGAEELGQVPQHAGGRLVHLERQEEKKEEVGHSQVEQEDVCGSGFVVDLDAEGVKCQDVARQANQEGDDVDRQTHPTPHHHGFQLRTSRECQQLLSIFDQIAHGFS